MAVLLPSPQDVKLLILNSVDRGATFYLVLSSGCRAQDFSTQQIWGRGKRVFWES